MTGRLRPRTWWFTGAWTASRKCGPTPPKEAPPSGTRLQQANQAVEFPKPSCTWPLLTHVNNFLLFFFTAGKSGDQWRFPARRNPDLLASPSYNDGSKGSKGQTKGGAKGNKGRGKGRGGTPAPKPALCVFSNSDRSWLVY